MIFHCHISSGLATARQARLRHILADGLSELVGDQTEIGCAEPLAWTAFVQPVAIPLCKLIKNHE